MAYSYAQYTGNGSTVNFLIPFGYISQDHIEVRVDGALKTLTTHYTFLNDTTIHFLTAPASSTTVEVRRVTPRDEAQADFSDGSTLAEFDLDTAVRAAMYLGAEAIDSGDEALSLDSSSRWDADSHRIINVSTPTASTDAATKAYVDAIAAGGSSSVPTIASTDESRVLKTDGIVAAWGAFLRRPRFKFAVSGDNLVVSVDGCKTIPVKRASGWADTTLSGGTLSMAYNSARVDNVAAQTLANSTVYYVYAFDNSGAIGLDFSQTAWAYDTDTGIPIKNGLATRTLLGMVRVGTAAFVSFHILNWWERHLKTQSVMLGSDESLTANAAEEINTTLRNGFLTWADEAVQFFASTKIKTNVPDAVGLYVKLDNTSILPPKAAEESVGDYPTGLTVAGAFTTTEGYHYVTPWALYSENDSTSGTAYADDFTGIQVVVRG